MTKTLVKYLMLEAELFHLRESPKADEIRDQMDPLWYAMSDEERESLTRRIISKAFMDTISIPASEVFI